MLLLGVLPTTPRPLILHNWLRLAKLFTERSVKWPKVDPTEGISLHMQHRIYVGCRDAPEDPVAMIAPVVVHAKVQWVCPCIGQGFCRSPSHDGLEPSFYTISRIDL